MYVVTCPELDVASQGETVEQARENLIEAIELFLEIADPGEVESRRYNEVYFTQIRVSTS
jgi:predicted RNase H-like HicB family nuclease